MLRKHHKAFVLETRMPKWLKRSSKMRSRKKIEVAMQEWERVLASWTKRTGGQTVDHMCLHEEEELSPSVRKVESQRAARSYNARRWFSVAFD